MTNVQVSIGLGRETSVDLLHRLFVVDASKPALLERIRRLLAGDRLARLIGLEGFFLGFGGGLLGFFLEGSLGGSFGLCGGCVDRRVLGFGVRHVGS